MHTSRGVTTQGDSQLFMSSHGEGVSLRDTSTLSWEEPGIELATSRSPADPLYLLSYVPHAAVLFSHQGCVGTNNRTQSGFPPHSTQGCVKEHVFGKGRWPCRYFLFLRVTNSGVFVRRVGDSCICQWTSRWCWSSGGAVNPNLLSASPNCPLLQSLLRRAA